MTIDADTRVDPASINHMVYALDHDPTVLACCGETQVDNKAQSWVTMIQVFEYYSSHHMKKAFESVFGCVTCLPGCFTMYRIFTEDMKCLIAHDLVYKDYSRNDIPSLHEKNLFELGEDRMLTTLLLQHFPGMSLSFVPEAVCWTIVPHTLKILLSQRRRWINSTFHNMYELLKVQTMCGVCFLSMKLVVIMDLIVTMTLPASFLYVGYLAYLFATQPENMDDLILIILGLTFGLQMVSFLIRSRFDYLWWFGIFTVIGVPVFYFLLPIYAFTHMDDFSWGKTRDVGKELDEEEALPEQRPEQPKEPHHSSKNTGSRSSGASQSAKRSTNKTEDSSSRHERSSRRGSGRSRGSRRSRHSQPDTGSVSVGASTLPTNEPSLGHEIREQILRQDGDTLLSDPSLGASTLPTVSDCRRYESPTVYARSSDNVSVASGKSNQSGRSNRSGRSRRSKDFESVRACI